MTASVTGFKPFESIALRWYAGSIATTLINVTANSAGSAAIPFKIPNAIRGNHRVRALGNLGSLADATIRVIPSIGLSPTSGPRNTTVGVTLRGFGAGVVVNVLWVSEHKHKWHAAHRRGGHYLVAGRRHHELQSAAGQVDGASVEGREKVATASFAYTTFTVVCAAGAEPLTSVCVGKSVGTTAATASECCSGFAIPRPAHVCVHRVACRRSSTPMRRVARANSA